VAKVKPDSKPSIDIPRILPLPSLILVSSWPLDETTLGGIS
jgi:hypothetical protein